MIQYILWAISFVFLWLSLFWINYIYATAPSPKLQTPSPKHKVTIAIPAFNEERTLHKTLDSIGLLDYPQNLLSVVVVDDGSMDNTASECEEYISKHPEMNIQLIRQKNQGKAAAINAALGVAFTPYFAVLDADTFACPAALKELLAALQQTKAAAAISVVKVYKPAGFYEKLQHVEYLLSNLFRRIMGVADTLWLTHGCLCVFDTQALKEIAGFSEQNGHTEDLEVALRLRAHHKKIVMAHNAVTYTAVPATFRTIWRQRIRWYRGFIYNHLKFRHIFLNKQFGRLGLFQLPVNALSVFLLLATVGLVTYGSMHDMWEFVYRSLTIQGYFINHVLDFPTFKELVLAQNIQITLPIFLSTIIGIFILITAFRQLEERFLPSAFYAWLYFTLSPYVTSMHWLHAIVQETFGAKRKWR